MRFLKSEQYRSLARLAAETEFVFYLSGNNQWPIMHNVGGTENPPIVYSYFLARGKGPNGRI